MKRPLWVIGISMLIALVAAFLFPESRWLPLSVALALTGLLAFLVFRTRTLLPAIILLSLSLGLVLGGFYRYKNLSPFQQYYDQQLEVTGLVTEATPTSKGMRYRIVASFPQTSLPDTQLILRDYDSMGLRVGESIRTEITLKLPKYDKTADYYRRGGIVGEATLDAPAVSIPHTTFYNKLLSKVVIFRLGIAAKLNRVLPADSSGLVSGMVFGINGGIDSRLYSYLNRAGTSHLLSVSGVHLSIFTSFIFLVAGALGLRERARLLLAIAASILFTLLVGLSAPVVRSCIMSVITLLAQLIRRDSDSLNNLGLSAIIIAFVWPYWALSLGMWLSFLSTAGIIIVGLPVASKLKARYHSASGLLGNLMGWVTSGLGVTAGAYLFTLPIMVMYNGWLSLVSPLANLLVAPFSTIIVVVGIVVALIPSGLPFYPLLVWLLDFSCRMTVEVSKVLARLPFAVLPVDNIVAFLSVAAVFILIVVLLRAKKQAAIIISACIILISLGQIVPTGYSSNKTQLVTLGEDFTLLIRDKSAVVIGNPDKYSAQRLSDYLIFRGIETIDCIVSPLLPDQPGSGWGWILENFTLRSIAAEDDAYLLEQLSEVVAGVPVYSIDYATVKFFGRCTLTTEKSSGDINITVGNQSIVLYNSTQSTSGGRTIYISPKGELTLPYNITPTAYFIGRSVYEETRVYLPD